MGSAGVCQHFKLFAVGNEFIDEGFAILVVAIVITCSVDKKNITFKLVCESDGRAVCESFRVVNRQTHVSLLIDSVVESLVGNKCNGDASVIQVGVTEERV